MGALTAETRHTLALIEAEVVTDTRVAQDVFHLYDDPVLLCLTNRVWRTGVECYPTMADPYYAAVSWIAQHPEVVCARGLELFPVSDDQTRLLCTQQYGATTMTWHFVWASSEALLNGWAWSKTRVAGLYLVGASFSNPWYSEEW